ncbi:hypothetical protein RvY_07881 [Ramazzottius varieornatus]|uniref:Uncharacterized protein n=1 Tax=Ramazzottius varieornatus TaxID=947166 RepID=A0A1D1VC28_RAMVA|nr:hypothetical protein RvY_07881 [Ramazzottius varieornatus]
MPSHLTSASRGFHPLEEAKAPLKALMVLSGIQITLGLFSIIVQGIFTGIILLHLQPEMRHFLVSFGFWAGIVFVTTGITGLRLRKGHFLPPFEHTNSKQSNYRPVATAFLTMCIVSALCAGVLFALNAVSLFWLSHRPLFPAPFYVMLHRDIYLYTPLTATLLAIGVLQLVLSAVSASLCCSVRFHCCRGRRQHSGRTRLFIDYPSSTLDSAMGSLARRLRSYSQFSLVPPPNVTTQQGSSSQVPPVPSFTNRPPPSYEEAWEDREVANQSTVPVIASPPPAENLQTTIVSVEPTMAAREGHSSTRVYQNVSPSQLSRSRSRTSF